MLRLCVYGTLKQGYWNHGAFCEGVLEVREAQVRGRLYEGPGFPLLEFPVEDVRAHGTADLLADVATQARLSDHVAPHPPDRSPKVHTGRLGRRVRGAAHRRRPLSSLPCIDRLESFRPGGSSLYRRVLVPATVEGARELAWVYTVEATRIKRRRIVSGC